MKYAYCYWCAARRLLRYLRRITLSGPARRRVYECKEACANEVQP